MILKLTSAILAFLAVFGAADVAVPQQVVCYYDSKGGFRTGDALFSAKYLSEAADLCTYLIYGYASINKNTFLLEPLNPSFDVYQYKNYQEVVSLKASFPKLRILLSVGGGRDIDNTDKYLTLLEYPEKRKTFVASATDLVKKHGFDGIDLAWQFPQNKPKTSYTGFWGSAWNTIKKPFVSHTVDAKANEHNHQFVELVDELKKSCQSDGLTLSLSVLPNVNSTLFYNIPKLIPNLDLVNLWAFDFFTPERNHKEADLPAPLYHQSGRKFDENAEYLVTYWCENGAPSHKLFLGIPTFARTWKTVKPGVSCIPPLTDVDGPGVPGIYTKEAGLLSYPEVYAKLKEPITLTGISTVLKDGFANPKYATYALFASELSQHKDTWAGFEDLDTVKYKATFARLKGLGGVAIIDLTLDDFKGVCTGLKYPLLRAALPEGLETKIPVTTIPSSNFEPAIFNEKQEYVESVPTKQDYVKSK